MPESEIKTNRTQAIKLFTQDLPNLRPHETTNYRVALLLKKKLVEQDKVPNFLISAVLASMLINVKPKIFREEYEIVEQCITGLATYIGNLYIVTQQNFDTEVFRSMVRSLSFVLDW